jgi:hypothetical protein
MASNSLYPSEIALTKAALSAQMVPPKDEFSTLTPVNTSPDFVNNAAPTLKREYGA